MRFFTLEQGRMWCGSDSRFLNDDRNPKTRDAILQWKRFLLSELPAVRLHWFAGTLLDVLGPWEEALFLITDSRAWGQENLHLYYRFRQAYGDHSVLSESPCHLVFNYEKPDLQTLVELSLLNGWSAHVFTSHDYGRLFLSASHYVEIGVQDLDKIASFNETLGRADLHLPGTDTASD